MIAKIATRPADARVTLAQIGRMTLARVGAREYLRDDRDGILTFRVGMGPTLRKVIVRLAADDTYRVEVGRMPRRGAAAFTWIVEGVAEGVYAEQLAETVEALYNEAVR